MIGVDCALVRQWAKLAGQNGKRRQNKTAERSRRLPSYTKCDHSFNRQTAQNKENDWYGPISLFWAPEFCTLWFVSEIFRAVCEQRITVIQPSQNECADTNVSSLSSTNQIDSCNLLIKGHSCQHQKLLMFLKTFSVKSEVEKKKLQYLNSKQETVAFVLIIYRDTPKQGRA